MSLYTPPIVRATGTPPTGENEWLYYDNEGKSQILDGTTASPDAIAEASFKVSRVMVMTRASLDSQTGSAGTDGGEVLAAINGTSVASAAACEVQPVGLGGFASTISTSGLANADACGVYGVGRAFGAGATGSGVGGFFLGRRDVTTAGAVGIEVALANYAGAAGVYSATVTNRTKAVAVNALGDADSAVGIQMGNAFGFQFEVGIAFNGQVVGGKTGPCSTASIRDDSTSVRVMDINGSHTDIFDTQGATISGKLFKITTPGTYTPTNVSADRSYNANATSIDELADVLGSLIADLQTLGLVA